ncbi:MAG: histidine--tRNA ligase [Candidatus Gracilibacteria bacterium]
MTIKIDQISGFPENLPEVQIVEDNFKEIIKKNYLRAGFNSLETSLVEREDVLCSKGANDNEIYGLHRLNGEISDDSKLGLRYDLTVPLARYVSLNNDKLVFPFKRFQIQKVYRGERAQRGRFREFYQADIDIIGNGNLPLMADSEIISTIYYALKELEIGKFVINLNHKELLVGFLSDLGISEQRLLIIIAMIDKKDKVDSDKDNFPKTRNSMLVELNDEKIVSKIIDFIKLGNNGNLNEIENFLGKDVGYLVKKGLEELKIIHNSLLSLGVPRESLKINPSISRGLNYYTGFVFETFISGYEKLGSIASGGRYENLTGNFIKNKYPGSGGSIGLSRLLSIIQEINKLIFTKKTLTNVLVLNLDEKYLNNYLTVLNYLRNNGINAEFYLETAKIAKQIKYAENKGIKYILIMGDDEIDRGIVALKDLEKKEQIELKLEYVLEKISIL